MSALPDPAARLFQLEAGRLDLERNRDFVIGRLLEEGDSEDLRWLAAWVGEGTLGEWVTRRGARQLSIRSLRFWVWALGLKSDGAKKAGDLWPL